MVEDLERGNLPRGVDFADFQRPRLEGLIHRRVVQTAAARQAEAEDLESRGLLQAFDLDRLQQFTQGISHDGLNLPVPNRPEARPPAEWPDLDPQPSR